MWDDRPRPMTVPPPIRAAQHTPTGGAWLGVGIAARAAMSVATAMTTLATAAGIAVAVDFFSSMGDPADRPPQAGKLFDVMLDGAAILAPYARIAGGSGVVIGVALFVAAAMVVRGSETGRRAARALLVVEAAHSIAAAAWIAVLSCTTLARWNERYQAAVAEFVEVLPGGARRMPLVFRIEGWTNAVFYGAWGIVSASVVLTLCWLAGRPFAREWCAARGAKSPVAPARWPR